MPGYRTPAAHSEQNIEHPEHNLENNLARQNYLRCQANYHFVMGKTLLEMQKNYIEAKQEFEISLSYFDQYLQARGLRIDTISQVKSISKKVEIIKASMFKIKIYLQLFEAALNIDDTIIAADPDNHFPYLQKLVCLRRLGLVQRAYDFATFCVERFLADEKWRDVYWQLSSWQLSSFLRPQLPPPSPPRPIVWMRWKPYNQETACIAFMTNTVVETDAEASPKFRPLHYRLRHFVI